MTCNIDHSLNYFPESISSEEGGWNAHQPRKVASSCSKQFFNSYAKLQIFIEQMLAQNLEPKNDRTLSQKTTTSAHTEFLTPWHLALLSSRLSERYAFEIKISMPSALWNGSRTLSWYKFFFVDRNLAGCAILPWLNSSIPGSGWKSNMYADEVPSLFHGT